MNTSDKERSAMSAQSSDTAIHTKLTEAREKIERASAETDVRKQIRRQSDEQAELEHNKQREGERQRRVEDEKHAQAVAEKKRAALDYAESYRQRLRLERASGASLKRKRELEAKAQKEQLLKEQRAKEVSSVLEAERKEAEERTARVSELLGRVSATSSEREKSKEQTVNNEPSELAPNQPPVEEKPIETEQIEAETARDPETSEEGGVICIDAGGVGSEVLHIEGVSVSGITFGNGGAATPAANDGAASAKKNSIAFIPVMGAVAHASADRETESCEISAGPVTVDTQTKGNENIIAVPAMQNGGLADEICDTLTYTEGECVTDNLPDGDYRSGSYEGIAYTLGYDKNQRARLEREAMIADAKRESSKDSLSKIKIGENIDTGVGEIYSDVLCDPYESETVDKKSLRDKKKAEKRIENEALIEADRAERKRKTENKELIVADSRAVAEGLSQDERKALEKKEREERRRELLGIANDERKQKASSHKNFAKSEKEPKSFNKRAVRKAVKKQKKLDEALIETRYDDALRKITFNRDMEALKFSERKRKKNKKITKADIRQVKREMKRALAFERRDNERYYYLLELDIDNAKLKSRANREKLKELKEELAELLLKRDELDKKLIEAYTGTGKRGKNSFSAACDAAERRGRQKEYKRQRKLAARASRVRMSYDLRKKLFLLLDERVVNAGELAVIKYRLKKEKTKGKAKRELKKERRILGKQMRRSRKKIERYAKRGFIGAKRREKAKRAAIAGWVSLFLLVAAITAVWIFREPIWQIIKSLIGM